MGGATDGHGGANCRPRRGRWAGHFGRPPDWHTGSGRQTDWGPSTQRGSWKCPRRASDGTGRGLERSQAGTPAGRGGVQKNSPRLEMEPEKGWRRRPSHLGGQVDGCAACGHGGSWKLPRRMGRPVRRSVARTTWGRHTDGGGK